MDTLNFDLNRNNIKPLYLQIYEQIYQMISTGELKPGDQVPPEIELAKSYNVSRITIRRAIDDLVRERLLVRRRGKGTFVAEHKLERKLVDVESFTARMEALGLEASAKLLGVGTYAATNALAEQLKVEVESRVIAIKRLRFSSREPVAIETSSLSLDRFPNLKEQDFERASLYKLLQQLYQVKPERSEKTLELTTATPQEAKELRIPLSSPLFLLKATVFMGDIPIEHVKTLLRGNRFRFRI